MQLRLTTAYNPEANGKSEKGHLPIIHALVKACKGKANLWPRLLPFALWEDRITHSSVTGYMPIELMHGTSPLCLEKNPFQRGYFCLGKIIFQEKDC